MDRIILLLIGLMAGGGLVSVILSKLIKVRWIWYIPTFISLSVIMYLQYKISFSHLEGFLELAYILQIFMLLAFILGNILVNIIMHFRIKKKE